MITNSLFLLLNSLTLLNAANEIEVDVIHAPNGEIDIIHTDTGEIDIFQTQDGVFINEIVYDTLELDDAVIEEMFGDPKQWKGNRPLTLFPSSYSDSDDEDEYEENNDNGSEYSHFLDSDDESDLEHVEI